MTRKGVLGLSLALVILLFIFAGSTSTEAQNPSGLTVGLQVNPDGTWQVVELFGQSVQLDPQSFNSVAQVLGLQFGLPSQLVPPEMLAPVEQADIAQLTLALEGEAARVWVNDGRSFPSMRLHLQSVQNLLGEPYAQTYGFAKEILRFLRATLYVRFEPGDLVRPETATAPAEAGAGDLPNTIQVGATVNPQGQVLSVAGMTQRDLNPVLDAANLAIPGIQPSAAATLAQFDKLTLNVSPSELMVLTNDQPLVEVNWDEESRMTLLDTVGMFVPGFSVDNPQIAPFIDLGETWLETTQANVNLYISEAPQDELPVVDLGQPLVVAFDESGAPSVAGMEIPGVDPRMIQPTVNTIQAFGIDQAQLCWQGTEVRWLIDGMQMPYLTADAGWLTKTVNLLGWQTFSIHEKLEAFVAQTQIPLAVVLDPAAAAPTEGCGTYEIASTPAPTMAFALEGTWNRQRNELALQEVDLPFRMLGVLPLSIRAQIGFPNVVGAFVPATVDRVRATVGADGVSASLDEVDVALHWDSELLSNLAEVADGLGLGATIRQVTPILTMAEVNVDIASAEGTVASSQ